LAVHRLERVTNFSAVINPDVSNRSSSGHLIKQNSAPFPFYSKKPVSQYFTSVPTHTSSESVHLCFLPASRLCESSSLFQSSSCSARAALLHQLRPASNATRCGVWRPAVRLRHKEIRIPSCHDYPCCYWKQTSSDKASIYSLKIVSTSSVHHVPDHRKSVQQFRFAATSHFRRNEFTKLVFPQ
jgi:hypothetical protein